MGAAGNWKCRIKALEGGISWEPDVGTLVSTTLALGIPQLLAAR